MKITIIAIVALLSVPLYGQVYTPQPSPRLRTVPPVVTSPLPPDDPSVGINRNLTVRLEGELARDLKVDLAITGTGPRLMMDQLVGDDDANLTCEYQIQEKDGAFRVSYSVGVRVAVPSPRPPVPDSSGQPQPPQGPVSITYRDVVIRGDIICRLGEPVEILRNGDRKLRLTLKDPAVVEGVPAK